MSTNKVISIQEETYKKLAIYKGKRISQDGKNRSFNDIIEELIESTQQTDNKE